MSKHLAIPPKRLLPPLLLTLIGLLLTLKHPALIPILLTAAGLLWLTLTTLRADLHHLQSNSRRESGRCPHCGYDLRATPHQCPECGHRP